MRMCEDVTIAIYFFAIPNPIGAATVSYEDYPQIMAHRLAARYAEILAFDDAKD